MELWIRSQDRTMLCKPQYIELYGESEVHFGDVNIGYRCVATYSTKERALEVLDEIQSKLKQQFIVKNDMIFSQKDIDKEERRLTWKYNQEFIMQDSGFEILPINNNVVIYEMPKE